MVLPFAIVRRVMPGQISIVGFSRFISRVCWFSISFFIIETPSRPALTRSFPRCFTFYVARPFAPFISHPDLGILRRKKFDGKRNLDSRSRSPFLILLFYVLPPNWREVMTSRSEQAGRIQRSRSAANDDADKD